MEAWHAYAAGGTGALTLAILVGRWLFSAFNGKADKAKVEKMQESLIKKTDRSTTKILFDKVEKHSEDISGLKENIAITRTKVEGIEGTVGRIEDKIGRALNNR
jgi:hypothetical protein